MPISPSTLVRSLTAGILAVAVAPALASAAPVSVTTAAIAAPLSATATTTVTITNTSRHRLGGLRLSITAPKGVTVSARRALPSLAPHRAARVTLTLHRRSTGPQAGTIAVRVKRHGKAIAGTRASFGAGTTPNTPPPAPNTLAGRSFWTSQYTINGIDQYPLYFTDDHFAYTGAPKDAWPTCAAASADCHPYSYVAATNQLVIDGVPATLAGHALTLDGRDYLEVARPPAGARWDTKVTYSNSSGICPLYCNYYTEDLTFLPDGTFVRGAVASGSGPVIDYSAVPANRRGTYEVRADGTLLLAYADGTQRIDTVAQYVAADGSLRAPGDGLILDGDGYFDIRD
jgi:hypothetical protein